MEILNSSLLVDAPIVSLIEEVEKRPALYKKNLKEYSDAILKKKFWEEVCEAVIPNWTMLSTEDRVKEGRNVQKRWSNLRPCFFREVNAQKNTKSGQAATKRRYVYFQQLLFLLPCMENRRTEGNLEVEDAQENDEDDDESPPSTATPMRPRKKRAKATKQTDLDEALLQALNETHTAVDEDKNFALCLVPSLQNLTGEEKLDAKIAILNIFKQIRLSRNVQTTPQSTSNYEILQQPMPSFPVYHPETTILPQQLQGYKNRSAVPTNIPLIQNVQTFPSPAYHPGNNIMPLSQPLQSYTSSSTSFPNSPLAQKTQPE